MEAEDIMMLSDDGWVCLIGMAAFTLIFLHCTADDHWEDLPNHKIHKLPDNNFIISQHFRTSYELFTISIKLENWQTWSLIVGILHRSCVKWHSELPTRPTRSVLSYSKTQIQFHSSRHTHTWELNSQIAWFSLFLFQLPPFITPCCYYNNNTRNPPPPLCGGKTGLEILEATSSHMESSSTGERYSSSSGSSHGPTFSEEGRSKTWIGKKKKEQLLQ